MLRSQSLVLYAPSRGCGQVSSDTRFRKPGSCFSESASRVYVSQPRRRTEETRDLKALFKPEPLQAGKRTKDGNGRRYRVYTPKEQTPTSGICSEGEGMTKRNTGFAVYNKK